MFVCYFSLHNVLVDVCLYFWF